MLTMYLAFRNCDIDRTCVLYQKTSRVLCVECGGVYNCQGSLNQHIKRIHRREKPHECPECPGKFFFTRVQLKKHQEDIHLERTHFCSHCNKAFARESRLKKHIEIAHLQVGKEPNFLCGRIFYITTRKRKLEKASRSPRFFYFLP